ncbi:Gfo/Idh/MocA family protein [Cognatishimia sp.]|uniref:Gfo/Idh/MocA family protein n=1 Tax=Cognatishimia sp. TaxID=2211648 RepID=UPI0035154B91
MVAYHPQWKQVRDWIDQGEIGTIKRIDGCFTYFLDQPDNIRNRSDGGALRDIGVYPVFASRMISGQTPSRVWGTMQFGEGAESDLSTTAVMQFSDFEASFHVNTRADRTEFITVYGTKGRIEVPKAFNPPNEGTQSIYLFKGNTLAETKCFEDVFQFALQVEHVSKLFKEGGEPVVEMQSSYENQKVIDAVIASVRAEKWVDV